MKRFVAITLLLLLVLAACGTPGGIEVVSGEMLSPEEQQSLFDARAEQESEPEINVKGKVYWSKDGTKYHKDPNCSYLKNATDLQSGTAAEAVNHTANGPCSRCIGGKNE